MRRLALAAVLVAGLSSPATALPPSHAWLGYCAPDSSVVAFVPNEIKIGKRVVRLSDEIVQAAGLRAAQIENKTPGAAVMFCIQVKDAGPNDAGILIEPDSLEVIQDGRPVKASMLIEDSQWTVIHANERRCLFALFPNVTLTKIRSAVVHLSGTPLRLDFRAELR